MSRRDERIELPNRAHSNSQKKEILERLLKAWENNGNGYMRLGQFLMNVAHDDLFNVEDFELVERAEKTIK